MYMPEKLEDTVVHGKLSTSPEINSVSPNFFSSFQLLLRFMFREAAFADPLVPNQI